MKGHAQLRPKRAPKDTLKVIELTIRLEAQEDGSSGLSVDCEPLNVVGKLDVVSLAHRVLMQELKETIAAPKPAPADALQHLQAQIDTLKAQREDTAKRGTDLAPKEPLPN